MKAQAVLERGNMRIKVNFYQSLEGFPVLVDVMGTGVPPGSHGFHVHESGDMSRGCESMGAHFDIGTHTHGGPCQKIRHTGDLGNLWADETGHIDALYLDHVISLTGEASIIGRGLVIHEQADDMGLGGDKESLKTGNAGARIACGIIRKECV